MTILVTFLGKVVGENRRLTLGRGRIHRDGEYLQFVTALAWQARSAAGGRGFARIQRLQVLIKSVVPARMDIDNLIKPCLDAMQQAGIIPDDNQVDDVRSVRVGVAAKGESSLSIAVSEMEHRA